MSLNSLLKLLALVEKEPTWHNFHQYRILRESWLKLVGAKAFENSRPLYINRNILFCATSNSVWAQNLSLQRFSLTKKINSTLSLNLKDMRFSPAQWYYSHLNSNDEIKPLQEHPSYVAPLKSIPSNSLTNQQNSAQRWLEILKQRQSQLLPCPKCHAPTPPGEIERWGVCMHCFN